MKRTVGALIGSLALVTSLAQANPIKNIHWYLTVNNNTDLPIKVGGIPHSHCWWVDGDNNQLLRPGQIVGAHQSKKFITNERIDVGVGRGRECSLSESYMSFNFANQVLALHSGHNSFYYYNGYKDIFLTSSGAIWLENESEKSDIGYKTWTNGKLYSQNPDKSHVSATINYNGPTHITLENNAPVLFSKLP